MRGACDPGPHATPLLITPKHFLHLNNTAASCRTGWRQYSGLLKNQWVDFADRGTNFIRMMRRILYVETSSASPF